MTPIRLTESFYHRDCLAVAPELVGKLLVRQLPDGTLLQERIAETEAYRGQEDLACHASKGRTPRTELLYRESGVIYVYLCYGIHWLMNVITGENAQGKTNLLEAVYLLTGGKSFRTRFDKELIGFGYTSAEVLADVFAFGREQTGGSFATSPVLWIADDGYRPPLRTDVRVGIDYAGEHWKNMPWRWIDATEK